MTNCVHRFIVTTREGAIACASCLFYFVQAPGDRRRFRADGLVYAHEIENGTLVMIKGLLSSR